MLTNTRSFALMLVGYYCSVMAAYKKYLIQTNNKDMLNIVNLYVDIETYCNIDSSSSESEKKKEEQAALISRLGSLCHGARRRHPLSHGRAWGSCPQFVVLAPKSNNPLFNSCYFTICIVCKHLPQFVLLLLPPSPPQKKKFPCPKNVFGYAPVGRCMGLGSLGTYTPKT